MAVTIKPIKIPDSVTRARKPRTHTIPKPSDINPSIPWFSVKGLLINGRPVGSSLEWNVAAALDAIGIGYRYQVSLFGGRVIGGTIADFEVFTRPMSVYVYCQGSYWHRRGDKEEQDEYLFARIEQHYHKKVIAIWEENALTVTQAIATLKKELRL